MEKVYIIAEAGDNHNGDFNTALKLVDVAKRAGADCVKFQTFVTEEIISKYAEMAEYQKKNTGKEESQFEMVKRLELSFDEFRKIKEYCDRVGIQFLSTPFDLKSVDFLNELGVPFFKIPSGEITNYPYLIKIAHTGKPVVMSTGMCEPDEILAAINVLEKNGSGEITLLHCNTEYPTPLKDVNLYAMRTMKKMFGKKVGYSDHTKGIEVPVAAVALGACVIEKHFTLDKSFPGNDHYHAGDPSDFGRMVKNIRNIEIALGDGVKRVSESERKNIAIARKSIVARRNIQEGEILTEENLAVKRPGTGINPMQWMEVLGTRAVRDFKEDELIEIREN